MTDDDTAAAVIHGTWTFEADADEDPAVAIARALAEAGWLRTPEERQDRTDRVGWYEFVTPGERATTHIAYAYEDGSVYLPEGPQVVTEWDFRAASATNRFWRLVRVCSTCGGSGLVPNGLPSNGPDACPDCAASGPAS